jgi:excinuclease ABC subunit C
MTRLNWQTIRAVQDAPTTCGVYEYWSGETLLYIGKAINLKARLLSHAQNAKLDAKEALIVAGDTIRYTLCDTEFKALLLESELIQKHRPPHNRIWKDDKSYLYILIDLADPFPRPRFARAHELSSKASTKKLRIFGPFPSAKIAEEVLRAIRRLIPFCMAKKVGKHPCFYSRIGLCSPCPSTIKSNEDKQLYRRHIHQVIRVLEGHLEPVIKSVLQEIKAASREQDFETALKLRTKIERFERFITTHSFTDRHFSYNNSAERLVALNKLLTPYVGDNAYHRIECYDASNSAMEDSVVSLVVMTDGIIDKGQYRRFKIKNPRARSDFDRLEEAVIRRLKNKNWENPDLIVIDGGAPQLRRLRRVFDQLAYPPAYLGLAKRPDRLVIPKDYDFENIRPSSDHPGLQMLEQLRDEAHRFANSYRQILESRRKL